MQIEIWTGQTKASAGTLLQPVVLGTEGEERAFLLFQSEGDDSGIDQLRSECVSVLKHAVLESEGDGYTRLESALKELNGLVKGFLLSDVVQDVHAVVGLLETDGSLHVSHIGRAEAYVVRDGVTTQITEYSRGKPPEAFIHIVSGSAEPRDHFIISTQRLLRTMTPAQLSQAAQQHSGAGLVDTIVAQLVAEKEVACILHIAVGGMKVEQPVNVRAELRLGGASRRRAATAGLAGTILSGAQGLLKMAGNRIPSTLEALSKRRGKGGGQSLSTIVERLRSFFQDLYDPKRKRRAHLLLLAACAGIFVVIWLIVQLSLLSQSSQSKGELQALVTQINSDISTAENRQLAGDTESASAILQRAEERAKQVMSNESGLFRSEALELLDRIHSKQEEMYRIVRVVPPRIMANLAAKNADIIAQGLIGYPTGEFIVFDRQDLYRVSLNTVEAGDRLGAEELLLDGTDFSRFQSRVFMTTGNGLIELINGQPTAMKTEDAAGWVAGVDIETYLRYLYVLSPEKKQIYKYERLTSRYGPPAEYNVNGDLTGALDMAISGPVYVLKDAATAEAAGARSVTKLLRGENQTFNIRNLPPNALDNATRIFKASDNGNFYFLDPVKKRVIVTTDDGDVGDSLYLKQYVLDSEQVGNLKDLYVDPEDTRLYVLDEKKLYAIDLQAN
ncbi:MAG: hypothetical protein ABL890_02700 [Candidatus Peribacteraceae bacterium]